jgi:Tfp pilus assembly protein PilF
LDIDPSLPEAQAMLGVVAGIYEYDWKEAERRFRLAMARDPVPAYVRELYGFLYLLATGRSQQAAEELERACKQDPLAVLVRARFAVCLRAAGRETEAEAEFRQVLELDENFQPALSNMVMIHALRGELAEALACAEKVYATAPQVPQTIGLLAGLLALSGDTGGAEVFLEKLRPGRAYGAPRGLAVFHLLCGEVEKAADWTRKDRTTRSLDACLSASTAREGVAIQRPLARPGENDEPAGDELETHRSPWPWLGSTSERISSTCADRRPLRR